MLYRGIELLVLAYHLPSNTHTVRHCSARMVRPEIEAVTLEQVICGELRRNGQYRTKSESCLQSGVPE